MSILILGIIKVIDNIITTAKNIAVYKNKKIIASSLVAISQMMFNTLTKLIVAEDSLFTDMVVSIGAFIGTYIVMSMNDKLQKDITYTNILTCRHTESVTELRKYLLDNKIKHIVFDSYDKTMQEEEMELTILAFAKSKYESSLIDTFLEQSETKYLRQILH